MKGWPGEIRVEADVIQAEQEAALCQGQPIEQVIFDFGNVLIRWQPEMAMVARYGRKSIEAMLDDSCSGFYRANDMMDGGATCAQARDWVAANCGSPWDAMFAYYCDHFVDSLAGPVPGARMLVEDLKAAGMGVWGLTNWGAELFHHAWDGDSFLHRLDGVVVSGPIHMRKPDPAIYRYALDQFGIQAGRTLFVDDKGMNVVGANKAGIRSLRFSNPYGLRTALIEAGVNIPQVQ